jgi:asparagine synthase (glutamine-hydrolysing)
MCYHQEEPFGGSSVFAQWSVMKLARQNQVTVLMDGQGADEILAGYGFYKQNFLHELYYRNPAQYYKEKLAYSEREGVKPLPESKWMHIAKRALKTFSNRPAPWISRPDPAKVALLGGDFAKSFSVRERKTFPCETLNEILYHDLMTRNLEDLLRFADRNSMAHSREIRLPFLSHKLVEFVFSLPAEFKIHNAWTKYILRESMKDSVPEEITWRKDKIAYETPERKWLEAKPMREMIEAAKINLVDKGVLSKKAEISPSMEWQILITANTVYQ